MICINEKYNQESWYRSDIYRKFEKQFKFLLNPGYDDSEMYVKYKNNNYERAFEDFETSLTSEVRFFVGFAGVGKTTFIKHYFKFRTFEIKRKANALIIPIGWNGLRVSDDRYQEAILDQLVPSIYHAIEYIYKSYENFFKEEIDNIISYIKGTRQDILNELTVEEIIEEDNPLKIKQIKLMKTQMKFPLEFACSILKYVLEYHNEKKIKRVIFIADDTETLSEATISFLTEMYLSVWTCLQNTKKHRIIANLLIGLRPHSYRFLKKNLDHGITSPYGIFFENNSNVIHKKEIPNIKEIFIKRFEYAIKNTDKPGNQETWEDAKQILYCIVKDFDNSLIDMISDLCHQDIRAITNCFQMILSNRVWCQEFEGERAFPKLNSAQDFRFDIVNVVRTIACGENSVYSGQYDIHFNQNNFTDIQYRPSFDGSPVFIPNIFNDLKTKKCDILAALIMQFLENYQSSGIGTSTDSERITKKVLYDKICNLFISQKSSEDIENVIDYLFQNRIIRKSIFSVDGEDSINILNDDDYIYFTQKGSRLLGMLESDSVLLEVFREDIRREYIDEEYEFSAFILNKKNGRRDLLFDDLIRLTHEIYINEDEYCYSCPREESLFYKEKFLITKKLICGIRTSLFRSSLDIPAREDIEQKIIKLENEVDNRIHELEN